MCELSNGKEYEFFVFSVCVRIETLRGLIVLILLGVDISPVYIGLSL